MRKGSGRFNITIIMYFSASDMPDTSCATGAPCLLDRSLEMVGDRWTMRILREAFCGVERFDVFQARLGVARNVLSDRLRRLVEGGLLAWQLYCGAPPRYAYRLTPRGRDFEPVFLSILDWTSRHLVADIPAPCEIGDPAAIVRPACDTQP